MDKKKFIHKFNIEFEITTMKTLLLFDSYFGNTELIARAIAKGFQTIENFEIKRTKDVHASELSLYDLLIVGSPTRGFRPTDDVSKLIQETRKNALQKIKVATFDTRVDLASIKSKILRKVVHTGGYAAKPLSERLRKKGAIIIIEPKGFYVLDTEGPLKDGELEKAEEWGKTILSLSTK